MWVTADCDGMFCAVLKLFQYVCSGVSGDGPEGNFTD